MGKDARNEDLDLTREARAKFEELVALLARHGFGEEGPPRDTTFAEIERFGHQAGRMVARAVDVHLTEQHAGHFAGEQPCPACDEQQPNKASPHKLDLQTQDGEVRLHEPTCHCPSCRRDFFPSTHSVAN